MAGDAHMQWSVEYVACDEMSHYCTHGKISRQTMERWFISPQPQKFKSQAYTSKVMLSYLTQGTPASGLIVWLTPSLQTVTVKVFKSWDQEQDKLGKLTDIIILLPIPWTTNWMPCFDARCSVILHHNLDLPPCNFHISATLQKALTRLQAHVRWCAEGSCIMVEAAAQRFFPHRICHLYINGTPAWMTDFL